MSVIRYGLRLSQRVGSTLGRRLLTLSHFLDCLITAICFAFTIQQCVCHYYSGFWGTARTVLVIFGFCLFTVWN
ncbi:hypothetical protein F5Y11DRAFT_312797 [Daldinia sp. FL1419]|nr:hypothetical protein F5Y11DRAFT_312797 [Daldinia sp. FL1419]